jgi:charged multivesicular body protein 5
MHRLFGTSKTEKVEDTTKNLEDTSKKIGQRGEELDKKINDIEKQLVEIKSQLKTNKNKTVQDRLKKRGVQLLNQKKLYESQRDKLFNQQ